MKGFSVLAALALLLAIEQAKGYTGGLNNHGKRQVNDKTSKKNNGNKETPEGYFTGGLGNWGGGGKKREEQKPEQAARFTGGLKNWGGGKRAALSSSDQLGVRYIAGLKHWGGGSGKRAIEQVHDALRSVCDYVNTADLPIPQEKRNQVKEICRR